MKVLVMCSAGVVRSVSMAHVLKHDYGIDALPVGHDANSQATIDMLSEWADRIIVMQPHYADGILKRNASKILVADVGPDVWGNPLDRDLVRKVIDYARTFHEKGLIRKG